MVIRPRIRAFLAALGLYVLAAAVHRLFRLQRLHRRPRPPWPSRRLDQRIADLDPASSTPTRAERERWSTACALLRPISIDRRPAGGTGALAARLRRSRATHVILHQASLRPPCGPRASAGPGFKLRDEAPRTRPRTSMAFAQENKQRRQNGCRRAQDGPGQRRRRRFPTSARRRAQGLPRHAADPPLRGAGGPALRHGPDRRLLPPLHRPGSHRRRHAVALKPGRPGHHRLPRPRPHAGLRHGPQGRDGRADRAPRRLLQGQGRLDAHVQRREGLLRRPRHRRRPGLARHRPRLRQPLPRQRQGLPRPTSATAPPTRARSTRASTWPSSGSCRSST